MRTNKFHLIYFYLNNKKLQDGLLELNSVKKKQVFSKTHNNRAYKTKTFKRFSTPFLNIDEF